MRNNQPVTNNEYVLRDDVMIVSRTDLQGRIIDGNKDFVEASGFEKEELIGQPHNIIRHPDMPALGFEDLWNTLKKGKPWVGFVKNRRKNGDYYWVWANATEYKEDGQTVGYISIRSKATPEEIQFADGLYKAVNAGQVKGVTLEGGVIVKTGLWADIQKFFTKTIARRVKIVLVYALSSMILLGGGAALISSMMQDKIVFLYQNEMSPLVQITQIQNLMQDNVLALLHAEDQMHENALKDMEVTLARVEKNAAEIADLKEELLKQDLSGQEAAIMKSFWEKRERFIKEGTLPMIAALHARQEGAAEYNFAKLSGPLFEAANVEANRLKEIFVADSQEALRDGALLANTTLWVSLALTLLFAGIGYWIVRTLRGALVEPLNHLNEVFGKLSAGVYNTRVNIKNTDEIGEILAQVRALQTKLGFAQYDLVERQKLLDVEKKDALESLAKGLSEQVKTVVDTLSAAATQMQSSAQTMARNAEDAAQRTTTVAAASEQATTNVNMVAAASEELSSSIREIGQQVNYSSTIALQAREDAERSNQTIQGLAEAAQKIGDIVSLINDIAGQTNLLALNATIEAARAGEAGKGFAVVASEVKNLASQTAKATEDISGQIAHIQAVTQEAVGAIQKICETIGKVSDISATISGSVEEQGQATSEITQSIQQAAAGVTDISSNTAAVTQVVAETGQTAGQVLSAANDLSRQAEDLGHTIDRFVERIRTA